MRTIKHYQTCMGHIRSIIDQCRGCADDEGNKQCEHYKPRGVWEYDVVEKVDG